MNQPLYYFLAFKIVSLVHRQKNKLKKVLKEKKTNQPILLNLWYLIVYIKTGVVLKDNFARLKNL